MWMGRFDPRWAQPREPLPPLAEKPPGPPPWARPAGLTWPGKVFVALVVAGAVGAVVSIGVAVWQLVAAAGR